MDSIKEDIYKQKQLVKSNIVNQIGSVDMIEEEFEKGKALPEGTVRVWSGEKFQKKGNKWVYMGKGDGGSSNTQQGNEEENDSSESLSLQEEEEALKFVDKLTNTGGGVNLSELSEKQKNFLKKTVDSNKTYKLYRGIGLIPQRVTANWTDFENLQEGDELPESLKKKFKFNDYASYTTKKSKARQYSEGKISIITQSNVSPDDVLVDTSKLHEVVSENQNILDEGDFEYFKDEKEVIVSEQNFNPKIVSVKK